MYAWQKRRKNKIKELTHAPPRLHNRPGIPPPHHATQKQAQPLFLLLLPTNLLLVLLFPIPLSSLPFLLPFSPRFPRGRAREIRTGPSITPSPTQCDRPCWSRACSRMHRQCREHTDSSVTRNMIYAGTSTPYPHIPTRTHQHSSPLVYTKYHTIYYLSSCLLTEQLAD